MSWIIPEDLLDPQQKEFIERRILPKENLWIKGFPGSGKSVLLAYTLKKIRRLRSTDNVVFVVFTRSLVQMFKEAFADMNLSVEVKTFYEFMNGSMHYDYVLCDEVQDLTPSVLRAMNSRANHVVVAGDENQSIYDCDPKYKESTVKSSQICPLLSAREYELSVIHRLSRSIIDIVKRFMPGMNILAERSDQTKSSAQVRLCKASNIAQEVKYIVSECKKATRIGETAVVLIPTQRDIVKFVNAALAAEGKAQWPESVNRYGRLDFEAMNDYLSCQGLNICYVGNGIGTFSAQSRKVIIMTYHSAKGLDFENVFIPFVNSSLFIVPDECLSKTLFMVAMTRSRKNLYITYSGRKHEYLNSFSDKCNVIDLNNPDTGGNRVNNVFGI